MYLLDFHYKCNYFVLCIILFLIWISFQSLYQKKIIFLYTIVRVYYTPKFSSVVENSHDYWIALKFILWKVFIIWSENDNTARMDITGGRYCVIIIKKKKINAEKNFPSWVLFRCGILQILQIYSEFLDILHYEFKYYIFITKYIEYLMYKKNLFFITLLL